MGRHASLVAAVVGALVLGAAEASAQNLVTNPGFNGDLNDWTFNPADVTFDAALDTTGTPGSGSARTSLAQSTPQTVVLEQCIPIVAGATYAFGGNVFRQEGTTAIPGSAGYFAQFASTIDCTTLIPLATGSTVGTGEGSWQPRNHPGIVAPAGAVAILIQAVAEAGTSPVVTNFDDVFVQQVGGGPTTATITVVKSASGGDGTFDFTSNLPSNATFSITTSSGTGTHGPLSVPPGTYSISETVPAGWTLVASTCDQGDAPASVTVAAGDNVTCTLTNQAAAPVPTLPEYVLLLLTIALGAMGWLMLKRRTSLAARSADR